MVIRQLQFIFCVKKFSARQSGPVVHIIFRFLGNKMYSIEYDTFGGQKF